jgi:hypothetical protein
MDRKIKRNAVISLVASILAAVLICACLIWRITALLEAFPGEPLTNPRIYNPAGILLDFLIVLSLSLFGLAGLGYGSDSIRRSRAHGSRFPTAAVIGTILGMIDQIIIIALLGFHVYLLIQFAKIY